ncbi:hypothetical protein [Paraliobacillus salinarum]|uniref:hypothetical protein n=1 Tax=Paraliobacillus salinarum TaxID=1158996 RepID=UPI001FE5D4CA|nr:hypothetical protein [Paraliobacillus salinarum]
MMYLLLILAIVFYLYQNGELQKLFSNMQTNKNNTSNNIKATIDYRYASGQISAEEYNKLKALL